MDIPQAAARLIEAWDDVVAREHAQTDRLRDPVESTDAWAGAESSFAPPGSDGADLDPAVPVVFEMLRNEDTVLDVGAGGGRLAIPIADRCREVVAVEPAPSMQRQMEKSIAELGVRNVRVVASRWEDAGVEPADIVICSHVLYSVTPIWPFLEKIIRSARRRVYVMLRERPPQANFHPLWPKVFGEERISLPAMPEFTELLTALGIQYEMRNLDLRPHGVFRNFDTALKTSVRRMFLLPGSPNARRLESILPDCLEPCEEGVRFKWAQPQVGRLVTWAV